MKTRSLKVYNPITDTFCWLSDGLTINEAKERAINFAMSHNKAKFRVETAKSLITYYWACGNWHKETCKK